MQRTVLKAKIRTLIVAAASSEAPEGIAIDRELLKRADIWPFEQVEAVNLETGARVKTFVIESKTQSTSVGGAAAFLLRDGHAIEILSFISLNESDLPNYQPRLVVVER